MFDFNVMCAYSDGALGRKPGFVYTRLMAETEIDLKEMATCLGWNWWPENTYFVPFAMYQIGG